MKPLLPFLLPLLFFTNPVEAGVEKCMGYVGATDQWFETCMKENATQEDIHQMCIELTGTQNQYQTCMNTYS